MRSRPVTGGRIQAMLKMFAQGDDEIAYTDQVRGAARHVRCHVGRSCASSLS